ncbi:MAG: PIN domain-containing protein [Bryobacteraceae bacterium]
MTFLVDTSVWSLALRRSNSQRSPGETLIVRRLQSLIDEGRVAMVGPVRQELLSGIRSHGQFVSLRDLLRSFPDEKLEVEDYEKAAEITNLCLRKGIAKSDIDQLLCAVAARRSWTILTTDPDFDRYAQATSVHVQRL